jgi:hypothetical protein
MRMNERLQELGSVELEKLMWRDVQFNTGANNLDSVDRKVAGWFTSDMYGQRVWVFMKHVGPTF